MPRLDAGWEVIPVEKILEDPSRFAAVLRSAATCDCILVDLPFVATVSINGVNIDVAIGVSSLVCSKSCGISSWKLARPAWASGVRVGDGPCLVLGEQVAELANDLGVRVELASSLREVFDAVTRGGPNAVVFLGAEKSLEVEEAPGVCGVIEAVNPLHPLAVVGKPYYGGCVERIYRLVGPRARLASPLLRVAGRAVAWTYTGLSTALLLGYDPLSSSDYLSLAASLGILYTCGVRID